MKYKSISSDIDGLPFILEAAWGLYTSEYSECHVELVTGLNWSPTLQNPFEDLSGILSDVKIQSWDPIVLLVHLTCPRLDFTDRGKSKLQLPLDMSVALAKAVKSVTKGFTAAKKKADRDDRLHYRQIEELRKQQRRKKITVKDAAFQVMEEAYIKASSNGKLPANARQIMYAARRQIINLTGKQKPWANDSYFTQTLLPDFQEANPDLTASWDVVYDARGKLIEPHTDKRVDIGTLAVRRYVDTWSSNGVGADIRMNYLPRIASTKGPINRYSFALFVEKEGFDELWKSVDLANRYDLAIMSTKGMSVTAMRELVARMSEKGVTILVLHDFDKAGFSIVHTLRTDTRRYQFEIPPNVVDLGLRLEDVQDMSLESEDVPYNSVVDPKVNLLESGATEEEAAFLVEGGRPKSWHGKRVELNAMDSDQLVKWLESKLKEVGVKKVVPGQEVLEKAYSRAYKLAQIQEALDKVIEDYKNKEVSVPDDLIDIVGKEIDGSFMAWDDAVREIAFQNRPKESERVI